MSPRSKKLIGTIGILLWISVYSVFAMRIALALLPGASWPVSLVFYALAGTLWIVPVGLAFPWMHREPKTRRPSARPGPSSE